MPFYIALSQEIEKIEHCSGYRMPILLVDEVRKGREISVIVIEDIQRLKRVFVIPESINVEDALCVKVMIDSYSNKKTIIYTDYPDAVSLWKDAEIHKLPIL